MIDAEDLPIRPELAAALERTWDEIGQPGAHWTGAERDEILLAARAAFTGNPIPDTSLPPAATDAAVRLAAAPATTTEAWVTDVTGAIGEPEYVELVGVVARVVAVDTFCRLLGLEPPPPPEARPGEPSREPVPESARRNRTWVRMVTPLAPLVLGAVPSTEAAVNGLCDQLYLPPSEIGDAQFRRGLLDRPRMELVAATVSQVNECFY
jgi:alkylhydroperoxidase family enzyme